jgi:transglutaminase-like putative cysteine protease/tetratricopeptide (TPR) repeat protein
MKSWVSFLLLVCGASVASGEDVSRQPPALYQTLLAPLLTPADTALQHRNAFPDTDAPGVVLLSETLRAVDSSGRVCTVVHRLDMARTQGAAENLARHVESYRRLEQRIHVVLARVHQPDNTTQDVAPNAVFLQTPQRSADDAIYSDNGELVVIYPNVKPGTVTESIVVIEDHTPRIANEFTRLLHFSGWWPQASIRQVLLMEPSIAKRLRITSVGHNGPNHEQPVSHGDWMRWDWTRANVPKTVWEPNRAPASASGPVTWLTTLPDWNTLGAWYAKLLADRDHLDADIAKQAADWTRSATNRLDTISILLTKTARDVRYTGLEFGLAGFQPQDPTAVWKNQYGDCKDKANLLRLLLRERHINAHLALVNTDHAGHVEKRSPDFRQFDHVILAIEQPDGGWLFCDPTIRHARPGMLRPDDADRDALLIKPDGAQFVRTPAASAGHVTYRLDCKWQPGGSLAGWLSIEATGYNAAWRADYYEAVNRQDLRDKLIEVVQDILPGAAMIDVEPASKPDATSDTFKIRAYIDLTGEADDGRTEDTVAFPDASYILPDLGDYKERRTPYWQWIGSSAFQFGIELPDGWTPRDLPRPFEADAGAVRIKAHWQSDGPTLTGQLQYDTRAAIIAADQFGPFYNALHAAPAWLRRPVTVHRAAKTAQSPQATQDVTVDNFPLMPTGAGQLNLLAHRFPPESNSALRRAALLKILQWFPTDPETQFTARMHLLALDLSVNPRDETALQQGRQLVAESKTTLPISHQGWGEHKFARWLSAAGQTNNAVTIFTRLAHDKEQSPQHRGWSAVEAARLLQDNAPRDAIAILTDTLDLASTALPSQYSMVAILWLQTDQLETLRKQLETLAANQPEQAAKIFPSLIESIDHLLADDKQDIARQLVGLIDAVIATHDHLRHLTTDIAPAREHVESFATYRQIAANIGQRLAADPPAWWTATPLDDSLKTRDQYIAAIDRFGNEKPLDNYFRHHIELLTRFAPDPDSFGERLWLIAFNLTRFKPDDPLRDFFLDQCDRLPPSSPWYYEGCFTRMSILRETNQADKALAIVDGVLNAKTIPPGSKMAAYRLKGELLESKHQYEAALACYKHLEADLDANNRSFNSLLRAILINLNRNDTAEALRLISLVSKADDDTVASMIGTGQAREFFQLAKSPDQARAYWQHQKNWWSQWESIRAKMGLVPATNEIVVPVIHDNQVFNRQLFADIKESRRPQVAQHMQTIVECSRWLPSTAVDLSGLMSKFASTFSHLENDFYRLALAMLADAPIGNDEVAAQAQVQVAIHHYNLDQPSKTIRIARDYLDKHGQLASQSSPMARLWGLAAIKEEKEREPAATVLASILKDNQTDQSRGRTVNILTQLLQAMGRTKEAALLLKQEISHPAIVGTDFADDLKQRYESIAAENQLSDAFAAVVTGWLKAHQPDWYAFAEPKSLADPRIADIDQAMNKPPADFIPAEVAKMGLLVATDPAQSYVRKVTGFELALNQLKELAPTRSKVNKMYADLVNNEDLDERLRVAWHWQWLVNSAVAGEDLATLVNHPFAERFNAQQREFVFCMTAFARLDFDNPTQVEQFGMEMIGKPLTIGRHTYISEAFNRLISLGNFDAAQRLYDRLGAATLTSEVKESMLNMRLRFKRLINESKQIRQMIEPSRAIILERLQATNAPRPNVWTDLNDTHRVDHLPLADALAVNLYRLRSHRWDGEPLELIKAVIQDLPFDATRESLAIDVSKSLVDNAPDDTLRASAALYATFMLDMDNPRHRDAITQITAPYNDPQKWPMTYSLVRMHGIAVAMRTGQPVDIETAFIGLQHPMTAFASAMARIERYSQTRDVPAIKNAIGSLAPGQWVMPTVVDNILPALEIAGMTDETELVREAAKRALYRSVLASWCTYQADDLKQAFDIARALKSDKGLPEPWIAACRQHIRNTRSLDQFDLQLATLRRDWPAVLAASGKVITDCPTLYNAYWDRARALHHTGRKTEAIASLQTYTAHCKDELDFPEAVSLLHKLEAE